MLEPLDRFKDKRICVVGDPFVNEVDDFTIADEVDPIITDDFVEGNLS
jgi:hypothetical protein